MIPYNGRYYDDDGREVYYDPNATYHHEVYYDSYGTDLQPAGMSWGEAAWRYLVGNPRAKLYLAALITKVITFLVKTWPILATFFVVADDVTVVGVVDDPVVIVTVPLSVLYVVWASIRVAWIHHKGNRRR